MKDGAALIAVVVEHAVVTATMDYETTSKDRSIDAGDREKRVLDTAGNRLGRVAAVKNGVARVEPTSDAAVTTMARAARMSRECCFGFSEGMIERVTENDVILTEEWQE